MTRMDITRVTVTDVDRLQMLCISTFVEAFASQNADGDMQDYLVEHFNRQRLQAHLTDPNRRFYFAVLDGQPIGYLKLNSGTAQTEPVDLNALEIERLYVLGQFHGIRAGHQLMNKATEVGTAIAAPFLWLGVWEKNTRAVAFYQRQGFATFGTHTFVVGEDQQTDLLMKKAL